MSGDLETITGEKLQSLTAEVMARKGYSVKQNPNAYPDIQILAVTTQMNKIPKYFINTGGRATSQYLTKGDMKGALPEPLDLSDESKLLIVTTCRSSSREARKIASSDPTPKSVWYAANLLDEIRDVKSEYLIELYNKDKYEYDTMNQLEARFEHQGISVPEEAILYICEETYHPRKIIAYIELRNRGESLDWDDIPAISKFKTEFPSII